MKAKDLRNSILQMAVQGKLVPQDPADEPATVLVERIRKERAKLIREKKIRAPRGGESIIYRASDGSHYEKRVYARGREDEPVCIDDEIPFEIPDSWAWARLSSISSKIADGEHKTPRRIATYDGFYLLSARNVRDGFISLDDVDYVDEEEYLRISKRCNPQRGDVLISCSGSIGRVAVVTDDQRYVMVRSAAMVSPVAVDSRYVAVALQSPFLQAQMVAASKQTAQANLFQGAIAQLLMPLPPVAEQIRIASQVDLLQPYLSDFEEIETRRERLDAELPSRLRKSVLQMAVQGRLVPQDPADEPASALLGRIRAERARLVREGKLKAPRGGESVIFRASDGGHYEKHVDARGREGEPQPVEVPFEIPESWEWARVSSVFNLVRGNGIKRNEVTETGEPCIRYGELYTTYETAITVVASHTNKEVYARARKLLDGEVVATLTGENDIDIGRTVVNDTGEALAFGGDLLALKGNYVDGRFAAYCMNSPYMGLQRTAAASGNIIVHLSADKIGRFLIAIPPLAEQRRIADACDQILALLR